MQNEQIDIVSTRQILPQNAGNAISEISDSRISQKIAPLDLSTRSVLPLRLIPPTPSTANLANIVHRDCDLR
jgi:hypothetical protein